MCSIPLCFQVTLRKMRIAFRPGSAMVIWLSVYILFFSKPMYIYTYERGEGFEHASAEMDYGPLKGMVQSIY